MGSSKKKSSFRIDDILQQQSEYQSNQLNASMENYTKLYSAHFNGTNQLGQHQQNHHQHHTSQSTVPPPSNSSSTPSTNNNHHNSSSAAGAGGGGGGTHLITNNGSSGGGSSSNNSDHHPRKPMPMYPPNLLDMQNKNFCFPLPMGVPPFTHAAAYLEHYANAFHKGMFFFCWPFSMLYLR